MRIFVTGAAGFIGSHYVRSMLGGRYPGYEDAELTVYDKLTYAGNLENLEPVAGQFRFVQGDLIDSELLDEVLPSHDIVVNFAAETHVDRSISGAADFVVTNVLGAQTLFDACLRAGVSRVLHVSTDEVYGSIPDGAFSETDRLDPNSPYAAAKAGGDLLARAYSVTHGLNISTTRCSNNYGPYQFTEKVVPLFITNVLDGKHVPLYGDGLNVRDWLHVDDHCQGIQVVLERGAPGEYYNIAGGRELTNKELTEIILGALGVGWEMVDFVADRPGHDRRYALDDSKTREIGYQPRVQFEDGIASTVQWYRDNRSWWEPLKAKAAVPSFLK